MLANAFAHRAVWRRDYPMVGAMRAYILGYLALVPHRRDYAPIHPVLCGLLSATWTPRAKSRTVSPFTASQSFKSTMTAVYYGYTLRVLDSPSVPMKL